MLTRSELEAMIYLLDDNDNEVVDAVQDRLFREGPEVVPLLEEIWSDNKDPGKGDKIEQLIDRINQRELLKDLMAWKSSVQKDLLEACLIVCRIQYPGMDSGMVYRYIEKLKLEVWMAMYNTHNPLDRIKVLNHILFERHGLSGNSENYHAPDNSFIHRLIETRRSNPITLCSLYAIVAQRLGLPVFGVNLPQHFVLAWCEEKQTPEALPYQSAASLRREDFGEVLFYINPFSKGQVFLKENIDEFLKAIHVEPRELFYEPCSNEDILQRMLRNLHFSYSELHHSRNVATIEMLMRQLGMSMLDEGNSEED